MSKPLDHSLSSLLSTRQSNSRLRRLTTFPHTNIDFSSNAYLSLSQIPSLRTAYISLLTSCPPNQLFGSGGSRLLDGNTAFAESLEHDIARFHSAPSGLLFNTGFDANVAIFSCLPQPGDVVVYDELIHASAHDGMRQSRAAKKLPFRHNSVFGDDSASAAANCETRDSSGTDLGKKSLDEILLDLTQGVDGKAVREGKKSVFVAVEGVYSMDGDVTPLKDVVACVKKRLPRDNGYIIIDEAHSTGIFGERGRGLVSELGLEDEIFIRLHTFGKAMSSFGAIVLCSPTVREYFVNYARTLIYTTSLPFPCLAGIKVTYDFLRSGLADRRRHHLRALMSHTHSRFASLCTQHSIPPSLLRVSSEEPVSPILPLFTAHPRSLALHCCERGYTVRPIVAPTVPKGSERVRVCLHAGNTFEEVDGLLGAVTEWIQLRLPPSSGQPAIADGLKARL